MEHLSRSMRTTINKIADHDFETKIKQRNHRAIFEHNNNCNNSNKSNRGCHSPIIIVDPEPRKHLNRRAPITEYHSGSLILINAYDNWENCKVSPDELKLSSHHPKKEQLRTPVRWARTNQSRKERIWTQIRRVRTNWESHDLIARWLQTFITSSQKGTTPDSSPSSAYQSKPKGTTPDSNPSSAHQTRILLSRISWSHR